MCLPLHDKHYVMLLSVYAPTLKADPAENERFYTYLQSLLTSIPENDKIVILSDFNATVSQDAVT